MAQDRGPVTLAITIFMLVLATVFVAGRVFTRAFLVRRIRSDDWVMLAAWFVSLGFSITICLGVGYGLGKHQSDVPATSETPLRITEYVFSILYNPSLMLTKTSICMFYLSVMSKDVDPVFKWCTWLTIAVTNLAGAALTFYNMFHCTPIRASFTYPTPPNAKCTDIVTLFLASAPVNIITDLAILFLPMPILTGMRLPKKQKMILVVTFSFGAFIAVVDVIRIAYLQDAAVSRLIGADSGNDPSTSSVDTTDFSWNASLSFMWSAVEVNLGIVCACVPSLKPLFSKFMPQFIRSAGDQTSIGNSVDESVDENNAIRIQIGNKESNAIARGGSGRATELNNPAAFRRPTIKEYSGEDDGDQMGFLNMLAGPDDEVAPPPPNRTSTQTSLFRRPTRRLTRTNTSKSTASEFGFVKMDKNKNMLKLSNSQSVWPIAVVTVIFFLWGFAYGLLATLNAQFANIVNPSPGESLGLHASYFAGYFFGPLTLGRFMMKRYGFKATMMAGLCVYGCGTLVFWPSAVLTSVVAFIISNFIVAFGLSCLETAANPYIALCGPLEYAEVRLNLSQGFQAVGTVLSGLLSNKVLFNNLSGSTLIDVQWTYLGIAFFVIGLAVVFYYTPLPEASDEQLEELADKRSAANRARIGPYKVIYVTLAMGVFAQWLYVGGQEVIGGELEALFQLEEPNNTLSPFYFLVVGHTVFAIGRFMAAFANYLLKPRWILLFLQTGLMVCTALQMSLQGGASAAVAQLIYFFEAGIFSIIYAISMRGLGAHTKTGSAFMAAAISGGAVWPVMQYFVQQSDGLLYSYAIPLAAFAAGMLFPLYLNLFPQARNQVDPVHERRSARRARREERRMSEFNTPHINEFGIAGIIARKKRANRKSAKPSTEHVESSSIQSPMDFSNFGDTMGSSTLVGSPAPALTRDSKNDMGFLSPWPGQSVFEEKEKYAEDASSSSPSGSGGLDFDQDDQIRSDSKFDNSISPKTVQKSQFQPLPQPVSEKEKKEEPEYEHQIKSACDESGGEDEDDDYDDESDADEYDYHKQFKQMASGRTNWDLEKRGSTFTRSSHTSKARSPTMSNLSPQRTTSHRMEEMKQQMQQQPQLHGSQSQFQPPQQTSQSQFQTFNMSQPTSLQEPKPRSTSPTQSPIRSYPQSPLRQELHTQPQSRSRSPSPHTPLPPTQGHTQPRVQPHVRIPDQSTAGYFQNESPVSPKQTRREQEEDDNDDVEDEEREEQQQELPPLKPKHLRGDPALHDFDEDELDDDGYDEYHSTLRRL